MMTAMKAAPRLPENNDGSSYLYISRCDLTPKSIHPSYADAPMRRCACFAPVTRLEATLHSSASLASLRRVKSLTHIAPELQAPLRPKNRPHEQALYWLRSAQRDLVQIGDGAQGCAADLSRVLCQRAAAHIGFRLHPGFAPAPQLRRS